TFAHDGAEVALADRAVAVIGEEGAFFSSAIQQERVEKAAGFGTDAHRRPRVDVETAHFDIFDAAFGQRRGRALAPVRAALGPDGRVVLVFDLKNIGVELDPLAVLVRAEAFVCGPGRG